MGSVHRGVHPSGREVALKVLLAPASHDGSWLAGFESEARIVASLQHPRIIALLDYGRTEAPVLGGDVPAGSPYLVMELADGELRPPACYAELHAQLLDVLDGLAHAHARGFVHRDLKPRNLLHARGRVQIADFGIAWRWGPTPPGFRGSGSPHYMAPEQLRDEWRTLGPWTDLYALGCTAWELASGRPPFHGERGVELGRAHLYSEPGAFEPRFGVPDGFVAWLRWLLCKAPGHRPLDAAAAASALPSPSAPPRAAPPPAPPAPAPSNSRGGTTIPFLTSHHSGPVLASEPHPDTPAPDPDRRPVAAPFPADWRGAPSSTPLLESVGLGIASLRDPGCTGREGIRDRLWAALAEVCAGAKSRTVVLHGAEGAGKTTLARWLASRAHETGVAEVWWASQRDWPDEDDAVQRLVQGVLRCWGTQGAELEALLGQRLAWAGPSSLALRLRLAEIATSNAPDALTHDTLLALMERRTRTRPLLLVLESPDRGQALAAWLRFLTQRDDIPVLILVTADAEQGEAWAQGALHVAVPPLTEHDLVALANQHIGLSAAAMKTLVRTVDGHGGFAVLLLRAWHAQGALVATPKGWGLGPEALAPRSQVELWTWTLRRTLDDDQIGLLELAATLGTRVQVEEWSAVSDVRPERLQEIIEGLVRNGLATALPRGFRFKERASRSALLARARSALRLAQHHHRCASGLPNGSAYAERRAHHILEGGVAGLTSERFVAVVHPAFMRVIANQEPSVARRWLDRIQAAAEALDRREPERSEAHQGALLHWRASMLIHHGALDQAEALLRQGLQRLPQYERAYRESLSDLAECRGDMRGAVRCLAEVRTETNPAYVQELILYRTYYACLGGALSTARESLAELEPSSRAVYVGALLSLAQGDSAGALQAVGPLLDGSSGDVHMLATFAHLDRGDWEAARACLEACSFRPRSMLGRVALVARAIGAMGRGQPGDAVACAAWAVRARGRRRAWVDGLAHAALAVAQWRAGVPFRSSLHRALELTRNQLIPFTLIVVRYGELQARELEDREAEEAFLVAQVDLVAEPIERPELRRQLAARLVALRQRGAPDVEPADVEQRGQNIKKD
jgi:serine/threonine protein kinase